MNDPTSTPDAHPEDTSATEAPEPPEATDAHTAGPDEDSSPDSASVDPNSWDAIKPWKGKAQRLDKVLLVIVFAVPLVYLALMPARPWLLANAPVLQEFINGAKTAIVAAAAFARVGELPLALVVVAGFVGMAKLDWAFWLAGRRWGDGVVRMFAQNERQLRQIQALKRIPPWALFGMTLISRCPGVPGTLVWLVAGWSRMRLSLFLVADLLGAMFFTLVWTTLGYRLGQAAVDVLAVIDRYALWVTLAFIVGVFVIAYVRASRQSSDGGSRGTHAAS